MNSDRSILCSIFGNQNIHLPRNQTTHWHLALQIPPSQSNQPKLDVNVSSPEDPATGNSIRQLKHLDLLATLVLLQVSQSFLSTDNIFQRSLFNVLLLAVIASAIRTLSRSKLRMITAITFGVIAYAFSTAADFYQSIALSGASDFCSVVVFLLLILALAEKVFGNGPVDMDRIAAAINFYIVLGLIFAFVFLLLEAFQPGSFDLPPISKHAGSHLEMFSELLYFSNVTLTSLGYGDINPVSRPARTVATLEGMIGQLYLAIVIARLVGLHTSKQQ